MEVLKALIGVIICVMVIAFLWTLILKPALEYIMYRPGTGIRIRETYKEMDKKEDFLLHYNIRKKYNIKNFSRIVMHREIQDEKTEPPYRNFQMVVEYW